MANPFETKFDSECSSCGGSVDQGCEMFAIGEGIFVCEECAESNGNVCKCGLYKSEDFGNCYKCYLKNKKNDKERD